MALIWSTRASLIEKDSGRQDQVHLGPGPDLAGRAGRAQGQSGRQGRRDEVHRLRRRIPKKQLVMFDMLGQGPANPATDALIPEDKKSINPVDPANMRSRSRSTWSGTPTNYGAALDEYHRRSSRPDPLGESTGDARQLAASNAEAGRHSLLTHGAAARSFSPLAYVAVPRRREMELHAARAGPRAIWRAAHRSAGAARCSCARSASAPSSPSSSVVAAYASPSSGFAARRRSGWSPSSASSSRSGSRC